MSISRGQHVLVRLRAEIDAFTSACRLSRLCEVAPPTSVLFCEWLLEPICRCLIISRIPAKKCNQNHCKLRQRIQQRLSAYTFCCYQKTAHETSLCYISDASTQMSESKSQYWSRLSIGPLFLSTAANVQRNQTDKDFVGTGSSAKIVKTSTLHLLWSETISPLSNMESMKAFDVTSGGREVLSGVLLDFRDFLGDAKAAPEILEDKSLSRYSEDSQEAIIFLWGRFIHYESTCLCAPSWSKGVWKVNVRRSSETTSSSIIRFFVH